MTATPLQHGDYIVYVDESGDHSLESINPEYPLLYHHRRQENELGGITARGPDGETDWSFGTAAGPTKPYQGYFGEKVL